MSNQADLYGRSFFRRRARKYHDKQVIVAGQLFRIFRPASVFDAGCGIGSFLAGFRALGVRAGGCDPFGHRYALKGVSVGPWNLTDSIMDALGDINLQTSDLCLCIEVAEHIDKRASHVLAANLAALTGRWLVFTAAGPGQRGTGHINCRPQPAWIRIMRRAGLRYSGKMTAKVIRALEEIGDPLALCKNMMVFRR